MCDVFTTRNLRVASSSLTKPSIGPTFKWVVRGISIRMLYPATEEALIRLAEHVTASGKFYQTVGDV